MQTFIVRELRALSRRAAETIASSANLVGCAIVLKFSSDPTNVLIEGSTRAQSLIDLYRNSGLLNSDPVLRTALDIPGTYLWKIPKYRNESVIWCDAANDIVRSHQAVGSAAGFWISFFLHDLHVAFCAFGESEEAQSEETIHTARLHAEDFNVRIERVLRNLGMKVNGRGLPQLSKREAQVAKCLAAGMSQPDVAKELQITPRTVAFHIQNMKRKLGLKSTVEVLLEIERSGSGKKNSE